MSKPLPLPLAGSRDLFAKLERDAALLEKEVTIDRFFNFIVTGYSLIDWIKKDPAMPSVDSDALYKNHWLKICGDLANAGKHFTLDDRRTPITKSASSARGYGTGRFGVGGYGRGEESIIVELNDGTKISCLELVREVIAIWRSLFE